MHAIPLQMNDPPTLARLSHASRPVFVERLGAVFEHSPWVAERAWAARPFADLAALHGAMEGVVARATAEEQLALIRAHPDLATRLALGKHSAAEQAGLGLDRLDAAEFARFSQLNAAYRKRFGFPFVIAVRHHTRASILANFETRLQHTAETEIRTALSEISKIAHLRLQSLLEQTR
jgi:OHCU decarboxylase